MNDGPLCAVLLSAGSARRMGRPKHLLHLAGEPLLLRSLRALLAAEVAEVCAVLAEGDLAGRDLAQACGVRAVFAAPDEGRAASIRAGVEAWPDAAGWLIAQADQPFLRGEDHDRLIRAFRGGAPIVRAVYSGAPGTPVIFGRSFGAELRALSGRVGGRSVLQRHADRVTAVPLEPERGRDVDRPEDLTLHAPHVDAGVSAATLRRPMERTLAIVKPDAVGAANTGAILSRIEQSGLRIIGLRMVHLSKEDAERFYAVHKERPFFDSLVAFMTSGPAVVCALEADGAIKAWRDLMGATNPDEAAAGTIRKDFATNVERNATHGSDAPETAAEELAFFFSDL